MIGIIGGSGFYDFIDDSSQQKVKTTFGAVMVERGIMSGQEIMFIPRHGKNHSIPPSHINYRANISAADQLNTKFILTTNAVGSLHQELKPGEFALPHDILDMTSSRASLLSPQTSRSLSGASIFDKKVIARLDRALTQLGYHTHQDLTLVVTNGPRFETPAEINAYRIMGAHLVGMTSAPEAFLARQLGIPYASLALISNYAAGMQEGITEEEVFQLFSERIHDVVRIFEQVIANEISAESDLNP